MTINAEVTPSPIKLTSVVAQSLIRKEESVITIAPEATKNSGTSAIEDLLPPIEADVVQDKELSAENSGLREATKDMKKFLRDKGHQEVKKVNLVLRKFFSLLPSFLRLRVHYV